MCPSCSPLHPQRLVHNRNSVKVGWMNNPRRHLSFHVASVICSRSVHCLNISFAPNLPTPPAMRGSQLSGENCFAICKAVSHTLCFSVWQYCLVFRKASSYLGHLGHHLKSFGRPCFIETNSGVSVIGIRSGSGRRNKKLILIIMMVQPVWLGS